MDVLNILEAAAFAANAHRTQRRKTGDTPYINHPLRVAALLARAGVDDADVLCAALLHDTVEDTDTSLSTLAGSFGPNVARIVEEVTDDPAMTRSQRKRAQIEHASTMSPQAALVKLADKIDNLCDIEREVPPGWTEARVRGYYEWSLRIFQTGLSARAANGYLNYAFLATLQCRYPDLTATTDVGAAVELYLQSFGE